MAERTGPHAPVKLSGSIPPLAVSFHQRPETGLDLRVGLYPGDTVVLTQGKETASAPAGQGGTGKTQIAVAFSHALWGARAVDALIWVPATSRAAIVTGFAQAAWTVGAADHALPADAAAGRFIGWLAHTRRPYRGRFGERRQHMVTVRVEGVSPAVLATWSLAAECGALRERADGGGHPAAAADAGGQ